MSQDDDIQISDSNDRLQADDAAMIVMPEHLPRSYDGLSIERFNSLDAAISALTSIDLSEKFDNNLNNYGVIVKLRDKCHTLNKSHAEKLQKFRQDASIFLGFESAIDGACLIIWRSAGRSEFLFVELTRQQNGCDTEIYEFALNFVLNSIRNKHPGCKKELLQVIKKKFVGLYINDMCDHRGYNLLMSAIESSNTTVIKSLIELNFNLNDKINGYTAADLAWNCEQFNILYQLLMNNSVFPKDFDPSSLSEGNLKTFVSITDQFHQHLHAKDENKIRNIINENPHLRNFFNFENKSAINLVIEKKDFALYEFLITNKLKIGTNEDFEEIKNKINGGELKRLREIHDKHTIAIPETHVKMLLVNSKFSHEDENVKSREGHILQALLYLNKIHNVSIILMIVAAVKEFVITYDFNNYNIHFVDPTSSKSDYGTAYISGMIYIGAKQFLDKNLRISAYAVLGHELTHFVMVLVYDNLGKPYHKDDEGNRKRFEEILKECEKLKEREELIDLVFKYGANRRHAELIVRIPHILAQYQNEPNKLNSLLGVFKSLNDYYNDKVVKDMEAALPHIQNMAKTKFERAQRKAKRLNICLGVGLVSILIASIFSIFLLNNYYERNFAKRNSIYFWHNLTDIGRISVENSTINFQGYNVSFKELLGNNSEALSLLSSDQINAMIENNYLSIDEKFKGNVEFYVERMFKRSNLEDIDLNFENLTQVLEENKFIILSDKPGSGKTTTYNKLIEKLKEKFKKKWVSYFDLKKHFDAYKAMGKDKIWDTEKLIKFIGKDLLHLNKTLEFSVFAERFISDNVILLWDGVDEISPLYKNFIIYLFSNITLYSDNLQWISTRPQYSSELIEKLNQSISYSLKPYSREDRIYFLRIFFASHNLTNDFIEQKIQLFSERVEDFDKRDNLDSPLIVRMFGELLLDSDSSLQIDNKYLLYKEFVERTYDISQKKGEIADKDRAKINMNPKNNNIYKICEYFAIKELVDEKQFRKKFNQNFPDLLFGIVNIDQFHEGVSRFGILSVKSNEDFYFIHRTFAEFFLARYLIDYILEPSYTPLKEDINPRIHLLYYIAKEIDEFQVVTNFIDDYIRLNQTQKRLEKFTKMTEEILFSLINETKAALCLEYQFILEGFLKGMIFIAKFMNDSKEFLKNVWQMKRHENLLIFFVKTQSKYEEIFLAFAKDHLPNEFTDDKIQNMLSEHTGNILFDCWYYKKSIEHPVIVKLLPESVWNSDNFNEFFNAMKRMLSKNQFKLMIQSNIYIMLESLKAQDFSQFIQTVNETLSKDEIIQSFIPTCEEYSKFAHTFGNEDEAYIERFISAYDQFFDKPIIEQFFKKAHVIEFSASNKNERVFEKIAQFALKNLKVEDFDTFLNNKYFIFGTILHSSIGTSKSVAKFLKKVYTGHEERLMNVLYIKNEGGKTIFDIYYSEVYKLRLEPFRILARKFPLQIPIEISKVQPLTFNSNFYAALDKYVEIKLKNSSDLMKAHMFYAFQYKLFIAKYNKMINLPENLTLSELNEPGLLSLTSLEYSSFSHTLYRDFFLAKILIDRLYNAKNDTSAYEIENLFHLFNQILNIERFYRDTNTLILNFLDSDTSKVKLFHPLIREKVKKEFSELIGNYECDYVKLRFFSKDEELLHLLIVESLISKDDFDNLECIKPLYDTVNIEKMLENEEFKSRIEKKLIEIKNNKIPYLSLENFKILFPAFIEKYKSIL